MLTSFCINCDFAFYFGFSLADQTVPRVELTKKSKGARHASGKSIELGEKPRLFVGGLKGEVSNDELKELFETMGPVTDVFVAQGKGLDWF